MFTTPMSRFIAIALIALGFVVLRSNAAFDYRQLCRRTDRSNECIAFIQADPRSNLKTSPNGVLRILTDRAINVASANQAIVSDLLKRDQGRILQPLKQCSTEYEIILVDLRRLDFTVLNSGTYPALNRLIGDALVGNENCVADFKKARFISPILLETQNLEDNLISAIEILNLNQCNKTRACG